MTHCDILIIDDDLDDIEILTDALSTSGVDKVIYMYSPQEAFQYLEKVDPECLPKVIVTDFFLAGTTATEFLTDFKANDNYKQIKVVVLSSAKSGKEIDKFLEMGVTDFKIKPSSYNDYLSLAAGLKTMAGI